LGVGQIVRVWDAASGELLQTFTGSVDGVLTVAFSPDGQTLASGGYDKIVHLWDISTGAEIRRFEGHTDAVESVSFSPDGRTLITASDDRTARLWDVATGQELRRLAGHTNPVSSAVFAPDGKTIATASFDHTVKLWAAQPQPEYAPLDGVNPNSFSNVVKSTADGGFMVGAGLDGLRLWDVQTGQVVRQYDAGNSMLSAAISPDGSLVLGGAGNGALVGWAAQTGQKLFSLTGHQVEVTGVAISPDGRYALTAGASDGTARLWELTTGQAVQVFSPEVGFILDTAFSPDGRYALASAGNMALMWAVEGGQLVRTFELAGPVGAPSLAVSPDGQQVMVGSRVGDIVLFDLASGQQQQTFSGHTAGVRDLAFSPDGTLLLSGSVDGTARLWEITSGTELRRFNRRPFTVHGVAFAPDGRTVLIAGTDGLARRFDVDYQETIRYLCRRLQRDFSAEEQTQYEIDGDVMTCQP
jgi:WD40 repeat protein